MQLLAAEALPFLDSTVTVQALRSRLCTALLIVLSALAPAASIEASCSGLTGDELFDCQQAESRMNRRAQEDLAAARKRALFVEVGSDRLRTTEFDLLYSRINECSVLQREGRFRVVDEFGKTFIDAGCRCCSRMNGTTLERHWELHGRYFRYNGEQKDPVSFEKDYWCGVEAQWLNDGHRESIIEGCDVPPRSR